MNIVLLVTKFDSLLTLEECKELQKTFVQERTPSLVLLPDHTSDAQSGGDPLWKTWSHRCGYTWNNRVDNSHSLPQLNNKRVQGLTTIENVVQPSKNKITSDRFIMTGAPQGLIWYTITRNTKEDTQWICLVFSVIVTGTAADSKKDRVITTPSAENFTENNHNQNMGIFTKWTFCFSPNNWNQTFFEWTQQELTDQNIHSTGVCGCGCITLWIHPY